ncbi:hypothetical protein [uncultured Phascolarctobacterium sp.]|uniref:hypothetical protein n=1 Tax=uncultured Phascolarctobacterium sp. TaxID=512296 RepID=UPI0027DACBF1|nr:hypothetical protein [uncultured Phascolarctobacterium sp.]
MPKQKIMQEFPVYKKLFTKEARVSGIQETFLQKMQELPVYKKLLRTKKPANKSQVFFYFPL